MSNHIIQSINDSIKLSDKLVDIANYKEPGTDKKVGIGRMVAICAAQLMLDFSDLHFREYNQDVFYFTGCIYEKVEDATLRGCLIDLLRNRTNAKEEVYTTSIETVFKSVKNEIFKNKMEVGNRYFALQNGVYDFRMDKFHQGFSPEFEVIHQAKFSYDPKAELIETQKFFDYVLYEDRQLQNVLFESASLPMIDRSVFKIEKFPILLGQGGNGKGIFYEAIKYIYGSKNVSEYDMNELVNGNQAGYSRADLAGKLLNYCSDADFKDFSGGLAKKLISGETISAREIQKKPVHIIPPPFIANMNELPSVTDRSRGFFRRLLVINFNRNIPEDQQDKRLYHDKILPEIPAIFNEILRGKKRLEGNNGVFTQSSKVINAINEYRSTSSPVFSFVSECVREGKETSYGGIRVFELFKKWAEVNNQGKGYASISFYKEFAVGLDSMVKGSAVEKDGYSDGKRHRWVFRNISIIADGFSEGGEYFAPSTNFHEKEQRVIETNIDKSDGNGGKQMKIEEITQEDLPF